jgi:hypothetical protein
MLFVTAHEGEGGGGELSPPPPSLLFTEDGREIRESFAS